jgi:hypothetical protein
MGASGQRHAPAALFPPGRGPPVPIVQEAGWAPESFWTQRLEEKSFSPAGDRTPIVQPVVRHYTAWANPAPNVVVVVVLKATVCPTTRHGGEEGREGIASTYSWPRY